MGAVRFIYDETTNQFKRLGWWGDLNLEATREVMQGPFRYCLQDNTLYLPEDQSLIKSRHKLCWGRVRYEEIEETDWLYNPKAEEFNFDTPLPVNPLDCDTGIGFGSMYLKRHRETEAGRISVKEFISQSIIDRIAETPDVLEDLSKTQFEELIAELFARMGFDVDLYRPSKDGGIDLLRVDIGKGDPVIFCVQCKHPDKAAPGKKRRPLPVSTVREIYGVAKANNLQGAVAITSSTYTPEAKKFADMKPDEIQVANLQNIIEWVKKYRWNPDE